MPLPLVVLSHALPLPQVLLSYALLLPQVLPPPPTGPPVPSHSLIGPPIPCPLPQVLPSHARLVGQSPTSTQKSGRLGDITIPGFVPLQEFCSPIRLQRLNVFIGHLNAAIWLDCKILAVLNAAIWLDCKILAVLVVQIRVYWCHPTPRFPRGSWAPPN